MDKEMKIIPPEGYEVDKENSTFECIRFRPIKKALPETWEEFCEVYPIQKGETYISNICMLNQAKDGHNRSSLTDRNVLPSEKMAEAVLALCQLIQLRDYYNQGWQPNWNDNDLKYHITPMGTSKLVVETFYRRNQVLCFKTKELCEEFLKNFQDLIEIARPLL